MPEFLNPDGMHKPTGYAHTAHVGAGAEWLEIAGQVGVTPEGDVPEGFRAQADQAHRNVLTALSAHGFGPEHIVKVTYFLTDPANIEEMRASRREILGAELAFPSTLLIVAGLATPRFLFEVEVRAAKD